LRKLDKNGESPILNLESGAYILDPTISRDGREIAFAIQKPAIRSADGTIDFGSDLYVGKASGGEPEQLVRHSRPGESVRSPSFMPDGKTLLYDVRGINDQGLSDFRVETVDLGNGNRKRLIDSAFQPQVSPDGKSVAAVALDSNTGHEDIIVLDIGTAKISHLLGSASTKVAVSSLAWSPDGKILAFASADPFVIGQTFAPSAGHALNHPTLRDIWLINRDGSGLRRLNDLADPQPSVVWAPDGASLYVLGLQGFLRVDAKTGATTLIGEGSYGGELVVIP
jgi:Tol biopolymer transport system component